MFSGISTVFIFVVSLVLGLIYSDFTEVGIIFSQLGYLLAYFLKLTAFFSFCLFLGMLVKRSAFALGFLVLWNILEGIVYAFLKFKVFDNSTIADSIAQFFPLNAMSNLIKEHFHSVLELSSLLQHRLAKNLLKIMQFNGMSIDCNGVDFCFCVWYIIYFA